MAETGWEVFGCDQEEEVAGYDRGVVEVGVGPRHAEVEAAGTH